jgi:hypothetical protein
MGFKYLEGNRWEQVTRDERFFCQQLYRRISSEPVEHFVRYISQRLNLALPTDGEWEVGYEVCFYRDLWQLRGRQGKPYSPKRTFDLCLFNESAIVIIEAKAAVGFDHGQNAVFVRDIAEVQRLTQVECVHLVGLCSSRCELDPESMALFEGKIIRWKDLADHYTGDEILKRADDIYEYHEAFSNHGRHSDTKLSGAALLEAFQGGAEWWVGRGGGIAGETFMEDVRTGRWKTQLYEVNTKAGEPPSSNYFGLEEFVHSLGEGS